MGLGLGVSCYGACAREGEAGRWACQEERLGSLRQGISAWTLGLRGKGVGGLPTRVSVNSDGKWVMLGAPGKNWAEGIYGEGAGTASVVSVRREIYLGYLEE